MPYRQVIPSDFMGGPRLSRAAAPPPAPAAAAAAAEPLHPAFQKGIESLGDGRQRDTVRDAPDQPPAFSYRTPPELLDRLPERARELLRRLDDAATDARDTTVSLLRRLDDARDRAGRVNLDVQAAIRAAGLPEVQTVDAARTMAALGRWPAHFTDPMKSHVARIVAEGQRLADAEAEVARLREKLNQHNAFAAPVLALRQRLAEAAARLRPPVRELELPTIDTKKAEKLIADTRSDIAELREQIAAIEAAPPHPDDLAALATEAVRRYGGSSGLRSAITWNGRGIDIAEAVPGLSTEDRRPLRPLVLLCAVAPDLAARAIAEAIGSDPAAPRLADRPRLLAEARARLREAALAERAAIRAMGDPLDALRADADPLVTLCVEPGR